MAACGDNPGCTVSGQLFGGVHQAAIPRRLSVPGNAGRRRSARQGLRRTTAEYALRRVLTFPRRLWSSMCASSCAAITGLTPLGDSSSARSMIAMPEGLAAADGLVTGLAMANENSRPGDHRSIEIPDTVLRCGDSCKRSLVIIGSGITLAVDTISQVGQSVAGRASGGRHGGIAARQPDERRQQNRRGAQHDDRSAHDSHTFSKGG